jgi:hypothetical protein
MGKIIAGLINPAMFKLRIKPGCSHSGFSANIKDHVLN